MSQMICGPESRVSDKRQEALIYVFKDRTMSVRQQIGLTQYKATKCCWLRVRQTTLAFISMHIGWAYMLYAISTG